MTLSSGASALIASRHWKAQVLLGDPQVPLYPSLTLKEEQRRKAPAEWAVKLVVSSGE